METVIKHKVKKTEQGTYYTLPFTVPENTDSFTVTYEYPKVSQGLTDRKSACIIDIGIMDPEGRFIGWSGSARKQITVGEFSSTEGYFSQPIAAGEWRIIIGAYRINSDEVEVKYTVTFSQKRIRLFYGDLHVHSTASDGKYSVSELAAMAKKKGLDFLAVADHNNFSENFSLPRVPGLSFIPAVEWTHYKGHMNFFGVKAPFENSFIANSREDMRNLISHARALGAVVSVNHPECSVCPYLWADDEAFDMMEIWNGPMRGANVRAIAHWTKLLGEGRRVTAVGGSDFHRSMSPVRMGNPVNGVYSESASSQNLLNAVKNGHLFVSSGVNAPALLITCGDKMMGDSVMADGDTVSVNISAERLSGCSLYAVTAQGEHRVEKGAGELAVSADSVFVYLKAVSAGGVIKAVTNPIYITKASNE